MWGSTLSIIHAHHTPQLPIRSVFIRGIHKSDTVNGQHIYDDMFTCRGWGDMTMHLCISYIIGTNKSHSLQIALNS